MRTNERVLNILTGLATACAVIVTSVVVYRQFADASGVSRTTPPARQQNRVVVDWQAQVAAGRRMGSDDAALTILYYGDFECPACRVFTTAVETLRNTHPGDVSVVFRHSPLKYHRFAYPSARAAECAAEQGAFEAMYRTLFDVQDSLGLLPFHEIARRAAVPNLALFDRCTSDTAKVARIERDLAAATATQLPGTPGVIIAGTLFAERLPTASELDRLVREARAKQPK
jgi:protein-disulfide isomerase